MSAQKANPRRATRRYLAAARHRAFMAELFGIHTQLTTAAGNIATIAAFGPLDDDDRAALAAVIDVAARRYFAEQAIGGGQ